MINALSFYLLNPKAANLTKLYVSISDGGEDRERFSTGHSFIAKMCNKRDRKGKKELVKKNTPYTLSYNNVLTNIGNQLHLIEHDLRRANGGNPVSLQAVRAAYELTIGKSPVAEDVTIAAAWREWIASNKMTWGDKYAQKIVNIGNHIQAYQKNEGIVIDLQNFSESDWMGLQEYFVAEGMDNSTINVYLKKVKSFLSFASKKGYFKNADKVAEWKYLKELKVFKISLKEHEIETILSLRFASNETRLEHARDLLMLEVLTGQRYSDVDKLLDRKNYDGKAIRIYQQKGGELISIPMHTKLENYLSVLIEKYPKGFPVMSNVKFNKYLKEIGQKAGFDKVHKWVTISGTERTENEDFRYNLITTHTGRRSFATIAIKKGIAPTLCMKVTGHKKLEQFLDYIHVDDEDLETAFSEKF